MLVRNGGISEVCQCKSREIRKREVLESCPGGKLAFVLVASRPSDMGSGAETECDAAVHVVVDSRGHGSQF